MKSFKRLIAYASVFVVVSMGVLAPARAADYQFIAGSSLTFASGVESIAGTFSYDVGTNTLSNVSISVAGSIWTGTFDTPFAPWVSSGSTSLIGVSQAPTCSSPQVCGIFQFSGALDGVNATNYFTSSNAGAFYNVPSFGNVFSSGAQGGVQLATAVPEPETYALLLAGLGLVGLVARRRKFKLGA